SAAEGLSVTVARSRWAARSCTTSVRTTVPSFGHWLVLTSAIRADRLVAPFAWSDVAAGPRVAAFLPCGADFFAAAPSLAEPGSTEAIRSARSGASAAVADVRGARLSATATAAAAAVDRRNRDRRADMGRPPREAVDAKAHPPVPRRACQRTAVRSIHGRR